jgi:hypothetical protein
MLTELHNDRFRHSCSTKVITSNFSDAAVLVLLMGEIYEVCRWDGIGCHDIHTKFHKGRFRSSKFVKGYTHTYIHTYIHTHTHTQQNYLISLLLLFQN